MTISIGVTTIEATKALALVAIVKLNALQQITDNSVCSVMVTIIQPEMPPD